jgi:hypothetical protein
MILTKVTPLSHLISFFFLFVGLIACSESDDENVNTPVAYSNLSIRMTDSPGNFDEVNIDIEQVRVKLSDQNWINLQTDSGIYNLLDFRNGIDTTIASGSVPSGAIEQIRFVLGDSNSVKVDGITYDLKVPSGSSSGLKLKVTENLAPQLSYSILVDFDAAQSIVITGNGKYILKPVLRVIAEGKDGAIIGTLSPTKVSTMLYALQNQDTLGGALSDSSGNFTINGLDSGAYSLLIDPASPYKRDTITNVSVNTGSVTDLGTITLNQ